MTLSPPASAAPYTNPPASVLAVLAGGLTTTSTGPGWCAGVFAESSVALTTVTSVAATPPNASFIAGTNPVPAIATAVLPAAGPSHGSMPTTTGAAGARQVSSTHVIPAAQGAAALHAEPSRPTHAPAAHTCLASHAGPPASQRVGVVTVTDSRHAVSPALEGHDGGGA